jgi:hypothetical protein
MTHVGLGIRKIDEHRPIESIERAGEQRARDGVVFGDERA